MSRFKKFLVMTATMLPFIAMSAFGQAHGQPRGNLTPQGKAAPVAAPSGGGNAVAGYVFGADNAKLGEDLAEAIVNELAASRKYSTPRKGARDFFRAADRMQQRSRGKLLSDGDFCKIGGDEGVQFLAIIDIEKSGRATSVWARLLDLDRCRIVSTSEFTGLVRNDAEVRTASKHIGAELLRMQIGKRSISVGGGAAVAAPAPAPRGNQIAAYVYGIDEARLGEELSEAIVNGLVSHRKYSAPRRGARGFFREVDKIARGRLPDDRTFCKAGSDYEIEYICVIDIEKAGRANSVWARIIDLDNCRVIATGEFTGLVRNDAEVKVAADEIIKELLHGRVGQRKR